MAQGGKAGFAAPGHVCEIAEHYRRVKAVTPDSAERGQRPRLQQKARSGTGPTNNRNDPPSTESIDDGFRHAYIGCRAHIKQALLVFVGEFQSLDKLLDGFLSDAILPAGEIL